MKIFDFGQEAVGFIAVGQVATGVIAIGQVATGVFAFGQAARGVVAIGQVSIGLVSVGMLSGGVYFAGAMIGVGGSGFGGVLPLAPSLGIPVQLPEARTWSELAREEEGWAEGELAAGGALDLPRGVKVDARLRRSLAAEPAGPVRLHVVRIGDALVVDRVMRVPRPRWLNPNWYAVWAAQFAALTLLSAAFGANVIVPLIQALILGQRVGL